MKYAVLVAVREYVESAKAKGFWIGIFMIPAILFLTIQAPIWLEQSATPVRYFTVVDQSGTFGPKIEANFEKSYQTRLFHALQEYARKNANGGDTNSAAGQGQRLNELNRLNKLKEETHGNEQVAQTAEIRSDRGTTDILARNVDEFMSQGGQAAYLQKLAPRLKPDAPAFQAPRRSYQPVRVPADIDTNAALATMAEALKPYLRGQKKISVEGRSEDLSAAILIPRDIAEQVVRPGAKSKPANGIQFWTVNTSDPKLRDDVEQAVNSEVRQREYLARGLDAKIVKQVEQTYAPFATLNPKKEKGKESVSTVDTIRQWAPSGFVYLLWLSIFMIVQMLLTNTIEEKSNRIIEVLLSSVTPGELMMGKLMGIVAIGLTMIGAWMLALFGILSWKAGGSSMLAGQMLTVLKSSNLIFVFTLYFILGFLMYAGFILSVGSVCNTLKEAQSYMSVLTMVMMVPLLTMTYIPKDPNGSLARILSWIPLYTPFTMMNRASADPPTIDLVGTFVLLMICTVLAMWMAGKIFRIGILRTGQPPKVIEMLKWAFSK
jgi:ABC-2 type transport system permease protein